MSALIGLAVFGIGTLMAAYAWSRFESHRNERERRFVEAAARSAERRAAEDAEFAFQQQFADLLGQAEYFARHAEHEQGLHLLDGYTDLFPMPQRPAPPPAAVDEPWQLNPKADADE